MKTLKQIRESIEGALAQSQAHFERRAIKKDTSPPKSATGSIIKVKLKKVGKVVSRLMS